ncbi:MAG TPA: DUF4870 domain-containing protein [Anaerolineales bacterium]|jgi:uncharacterized Tic20 family protein|nr:DUF4870 domain-containing protein [Anaerolineales bacterium]
MNTTTDPSLSSDEKLMGALAHLFGPLVALVVWFMQKDKSRFVKFQTVQALAFDAILMIVMGIVFFCLFGVMFVGMFGAMFYGLGNTSSPDTVSPFFMLPAMFPFTIFACAFPLSLLILGARVFAAISIFNGHNYKYPVLGNWLENFLKE